MSNIVPYVKGITKSDQAFIFPNNEQLITSIEWLCNIKLTNDDLNKYNYNIEI